MQVRDRASGQKNEVAAQGRRQTDRQARKQTDRQTERQTETKTDKFEPKSPTKDLVQRRCFDHLTVDVQYVSLLFVQHVRAFARKMRSEIPRSSVCIF